MHFLSIYLCLHNRCLQYDDAIFNIQVKSTLIKIANSNQYCKVEYVEIEISTYSQNCNGSILGLPAQNI